MLGTACLRWWAQPDSNQRPTGYEPAALPLSYGPLQNAQERETRFELATACLEGRCSTPELLPLIATMHPPRGRGERT